MRTVGWKEMGTESRRRVGEGDEGEEGGEGGCSQEREEKGKVRKEY